MNNIMIMMIIIIIIIISKCNKILAESHYRISGTRQLYAMYISYINLNLYSLYVFLILKLLLFTIHVFYFPSLSGNFIF
jgi:hypothetical protein